MKSAHEEVRWEKAILDRILQKYLYLFCFGPRRACYLFYIVTCYITTQICNWGRKEHWGGGGGGGANRIDPNI